MHGGELCVGVFVGNHRIDRGKNGLRSVDAAKNRRVFNFAPDHERWSLGDSKCVKLAGRGRYSATRFRIV
jgi:hypothetical protein